MKKTEIIPVVDIFAGPGGLSEGFSSFNGVGKKSCFDIALSIEKESDEVQTLTVRALYRLLCQEGKSEIYHNWLSSDNPTLASLKQMLNNDQKIIVEAEKRVLKLELGGHSCNSEKERKENERKLANCLDQVVGINTNWILVGGPPCQAYSLVGRVKNNSKNDYCPENDARFELYKQYTKILSMYKPAIFLLENVQGILSAKYKGCSVIDEIFKTLTPKRGTHYVLRPLVLPEHHNNFVPQDYMIPSERFGVPQKRHRLIIMGIRNDIAQSDYYRNNQSKLFLKINNRENTVWDMCADLPVICSHISSSRRYGYNDKKDTLKDWIELLNSVKKEKWFGELDPAIKRAMSRVLKNITKFKEHTTWIDANQTPRISDCLKWIKEDCNNIVQHESRSHMPSDLFRYLFAACYAQVYQKSPKLCDFPEDLLPKHANAKSKVFVDRFHVQIAGQPSSTIVSHISKDGHYYIHPDPVQCRSLTVREAARLQTFPDNYFFCGNRTAQFHQVGNAVPPYLAKQIAEIIFNILKNL